MSVANKLEDGSPNPDWKKARASDVVQACRILKDHIKSGRTEEIDFVELVDKAHERYGGDLSRAYCETYTHS